jgi:hypothetical protein
MKDNRLQIVCQFVLGLVVLAALQGPHLVAEERAMVAQPQVNFSAPYTRVLGAAPIKPPILFAQDSDAVAAQMETVGWYQQGAPTFALYRGFGGWNGPWFGSGGYGGFYGGAPFVGAWSSLYRPYGYAPFGFGGYAPYGNFGYAPFGSYTGFGYPAAFGFQPWTNPYYSAMFYPAYGTGLAGFAPFGPGNWSYGGCCYW